MKKIIIIMTMIFISTSIYSRDIDIKISERVVKELIKAVGPITNQDKVKIFKRKVTLTYTIKNLKIDFKAGRVVVKGDIIAKIPGTHVNAKVNGELKPLLNRKTNELSLVVSKLNVIEFRFLDLNKYIKKDLVIPLPIGAIDPVKIKMGGKEKILYPEIQNPNIKVTETNIEVMGDIKFNKR